MSYGVKEVFNDPHEENLETKIRIALRELENKKYDDGKYFHLIDIKYHTHYIQKDGRVLFSALIIYEIRTEGYDY